MKRFITAFLFVLCLFFVNTTISYADIPKDIEQGIYTIDTLNLSPDTDYDVQNNSFNERMLLVVYDSKPNIIQVIRLTPQSAKHNLKPLKNDYTILILGRGIINFSKETLS